MVAVYRQVARVHVATVVGVSTLIVENVTSVDVSGPTLQLMESVRVVMVRDDKAFCCARTAAPCRTVDGLYSLSSSHSIDMPALSMPSLGIIRVGISSSVIFEPILASVASFELALGSLASAFCLASWQHAKFSSVIETSDKINGLI